MIPRKRLESAKPAAVEPAENCPSLFVRYRDWDFWLPGRVLAFSLTDDDEFEETPDAFSIRIKGTGEAWHIAKDKLDAYRYAERVVERPAMPIDPKVN